MERNAAAVLGHPVAHSLSPVLHTAAYRVLGASWDYSRCDVPAQDWGRFWEERAAQGHWRGFSVTMPLKVLAAQQADECTALVRALGVANTLVFRADGTTVADNTDVTGIMAALTAAHDIPARPRCAILGGGGTATAAVAALHGLGAPSIDVFARSPQRAGKVTHAAERLGATVTVRAWGEAAALLVDYDAVISTLPPHGADELAAEFGTLGARVNGVLLDAAYDPWPSAIARSWRDAGGAIAPGVDMLIFQAVDQVRWFALGRVDRPVPREAEVTAAMCRAVDRPERVIPERVREARLDR